MGKQHLQKIFKSFQGLIIIHSVFSCVIVIQLGALCVLKGVSSISVIIHVECSPVTMRKQSVFTIARFAHAET